MTVGANMTINFNIEDFMKQFQKENEYLYNANSCGRFVAGQDEAAEEFNNMLQRDNFKNFVSEFVRYRGDFISSDREAAAFMFTFYELMPCF